MARAPRAKPIEKIIDADAVIDGEYIPDREEIHDRAVTALALQEPTFFSAMRPADKVAFATECANALRPILDAKKLVHNLNNKNPDDEYVELEGWQTCGALCGVAAKVEWTRELSNGWEARAIVVRTDTGIEVGAGESMCTKAEWKWSKSEDYARRGMAQTRAQSRALRGFLAWILVLAGYKPTPAEEMPPELVPNEQTTTTTTTTTKTISTPTAAVPKVDTGDAAKAKLQKTRNNGIGILTRLEAQLQLPKDVRDAIYTMRGVTSKHDMTLDQMKDYADWLREQWEDVQAYYQQIGPEDAAKERQQKAALLQWEADAAAMAQ